VAGQDIFLNSRVKATAARPSNAQLQMMDRGLAMFLHFSVNPWSSIEHNCVGESPQCIPSEAFNPTNLSTDQWVEAAVAMGAEEICLTAHHEGGFCLWDTQYSNYSVMKSPYGKDVVAQFVESCKKFGVKPCYYMGPNANGYLANNQSYSADAFVEAQLGMLRELLTNYGDDYVSRLWWDHYPSGCGGLAPCPEGSFPDAWPRFVNLVRELSPSTVICPGPDCDGHQGESGVGKYPAWFPCKPSMSNGTELKCDGHAPSEDLTGFHPYEACATMSSGWFCNGDGEDLSKNGYWTPRQIWDHYMSSVGVGWVNTLNAPGCTTGQLPKPLVANMRAFGNSLRTLLEPASPTQLESLDITCSDTSMGDVLEFGSAVMFNAVITREELKAGQRIAAYELDFYDDASGSWKMFPKLANAYPFELSRGQCNGPSSDVNLVSGAPSSAHKVAKTDNATACLELCAADSTCNTWTWHDSTLGGLANSCWLRHDTCYDFKQESHHISGACNHTLPSSQTCGSIPPLGEGVHGLSVGSRMIDFVPKTTASKIRFRCTKGVTSDARARIGSLSVHYGMPPPDTV